MLSPQKPAAFPMRIDFMGGSYSERPAQTIRWAGHVQSEEESGWYVTAGELFNTAPKSDFGACETTETS